MHEDYFGEYSQLIYLLGDLTSSQKIIEELSEGLYNSKKKFLILKSVKFQICKDLKLTIKKDPAISSQLREGLIKKNFVNKYSRSVPSVIIWSLDCKDLPPNVEWSEMENSIMMEYLNFKFDFYKNLEIRSGPGILNYYY